MVELNFPRIASGAWKYTLPPCEMRFHDPCGARWTGVNEHLRTRSVLSGGNSGRDHFLAEGCRSPLQATGLRLAVFNADAPLTQIAFGTGHPLSDQNTVSFSV